MKKLKKYYVVWVGYKPGIYQSWEECKKNIDGFQNAKYKSFKLYDEAVYAFNHPIEINKLQNNNNQKLLQSNEKPILNSISVDAACSSSSLQMEYQGVITSNHNILFKMGPFSKGTNNTGEFLAIVHALALCKKDNIKLPIYSDSLTAIAWVKKKKANTKLIKTDENAELFNLIERAENWLRENTYPNRILKWLTNIWGEIPADFGRK